MAYIVTRERKPKKGSRHPEVSYQVKWRTGGARDGAGQAETFHDPKKAALFEAAVEDAGENWPPNYIPKVGWVTPDEYTRFLGTDDPDDNMPAETLAEFADAWVDGLSGIEPYTRHTYRRLIDLHIVPRFGTLGIGDVKTINPNGVGSWVNLLESGEPFAAGVEPRRKLRPKSIRNVHGILFCILQAAADAGLRSGNPCAKTRLPRMDDGEGDDEMVFLTVEEFDTIAACLNEDARDLATFLAGTGLRYSEATALQVRDVELFGPKPRIRIRRAWRRTGNGQAVEYGPPKTPRSRRNVSLTPTQVSMVIPLITGKQPKDLVFTGPNGGRWNHGTFYNRRWRPAVYRAARCDYHRDLDHDAGIRLSNKSVTRAQMEPCGCPGVLTKLPRIHDLRHSHVAWLIATNQPMPAIQRRLGHESIQTTIDRYGHLLPEVDDELVAALDAMMSRGKPAAHAAVQPA